MKNLTPFLILIIFSTSLFSQRVLTLEESLSIALSESHGIKTASYNLESSTKRLEAVKLGLRTTIDMQFDLPQYQRSLSSHFNSNTGNEEFYKRGSTTLSGKLYIRQPLLFSNGTISLVGSLFGRDQFSSLTSTSRDYYSNLSINLSQPLFAFNNQKANLLKAEIDMERSQRNYTEAERNIIFNVTSTFFRLYKAKKSVEISKDEVAQTEESYKTAVNKFQAGLIPEVDALRLEVKFAESKNSLLDAEQSFTELKNEFKILIGLNLSEQIDISANLKFSEVEIDVEKAVENALSKRNEIFNLKTDIFLNEMNIEEIEAERTFRIELSANYGINKNDDLFKNIFREFDDSRTVTMSISVPVFDWGRSRRNVEAAVAKLNNTKLAFRYNQEAIKNEILSAVNRVVSAKKRAEVLSRSIEIAEKSYSQNLDRFQSGNITSFQLADAQLLLTSARQSSLNAIIDYKLALADLERKTYLQYN